MRTRPGSPRAAKRAGAATRSRPWRRLAAFVTASVATLWLAVPGSQASTPPPTPGSQGTVIVPPGISSYTEEDLEAWTRQVLADPMGRQLVQAHIALTSILQASKHDRNTISFPGNVAVEWFDLGWLQDDDLYNALLRALKLPPIYANLDPKQLANYAMIAKGVRYAGNEELFARLGVTKASRLIQVSVTNAFRQKHAEEIPLERFRVAVPLILRKLAKDRGKSISEAKAKGQTETILRRSSKGLATDNSACLGKCASLTKDFQNRFAVANYGRAGTAQSRASTQAVRDVMGKATAQVMREGNTAEQHVAKVLGLRNSCNMAMAAIPLAAPCGEGTSSGLGKALTTPVALNSYGGVDFSTLELRYLSDRPDSGGVQYSFSAGSASSGFQQDLGFGTRVVTNTAEDLRTWLVLNPRKFWVNLNPAEPHRIIDPDLGQTNAGRALLQADLQMKHTEGTLLNPDTAFGARYWKKALAGHSGTTCFSARMWIVPGEVQVRQDGASLYILKASLAVKTKSERIAGSYRLSCKAPDPATDARNESLQRSMVLPEIVKAVNTAPEYAPLRRAFLARIVAQWIRQRHQAGHRTSFDHLIDSGNLGRSKLQDGWRPQQVFDAYLRSFRDGEFTFKRTVRRGQTTFVYQMVFGGVDFSNAHMATVSAAEMNQRYPQLPRTVQASTDHPETGPDSSIWLGGTYTSPDRSLRTRITDSFTDRRAGTLAVILIALAAIIFGFRSGSRRRRRLAS